MLSMHAIQHHILAALAALAALGISYRILAILYTGFREHSRQYAASAGSQLEEMFLFIPPHRIIELAALLSAVAFMLLFFLTMDFSRIGLMRGVLFGGLAAAGAWRIPPVTIKILRQRRLRQFNDQLVDGLMTMSNALKAGFSIMQSFEAIIRNGQNPIAQEFGMVMQRIRVGVKFEDALANLHQRIGGQDLELVVMSIETARQTGGSLTEVLEKIAATIRERVRIENRIRTLTAMGRLQGIVLGCMPILLGLALFGMDPRMMTTFLRSSAGMITVALVVALETAGFFVIRKIIRIEV